MHLINKITSRNIHKHSKKLQIFKIDQHNMYKSAKKPFTIIVEGNVGSGKTTFLKNFTNNENMQLVFEPFNKWENVNGYNLLKMMYEDFNSWSFTLQTYILLTMLQCHEIETDKPVKMMERSVYSARHVFIENLSRASILSKPEVAVLNEWYEWLLESGSCSVDLIVYLRTDPEVAFKRIKKRGRLGEKNLSLEHIQQINDIHEDWLFGKNKSFCPAPVLTLNADKDIDTIKNEYLNLQGKINFKLGA